LGVPAAGLSFELWAAFVVFIGISALVGLAASVTSIWDKFRSKPPLHQQYAALGHIHADALSKDDKDALRDETTRELMTIRQEMGNSMGKVERQIDHLRNALGTQSSQIMKRMDKIDVRNDDRIGHVYDALNPLAPRIAAAEASLNNHLADHRANHNLGG
jgi:hypothetical protein